MERMEQNGKVYSRQDVLDELEFSLGLLEPSEFTVIPVRVSLRKKDDRFSGLVVSYKGVEGFVPKDELKEPYYNLECAQKLVEERIPIQVYLQGII